MRIRNAKISDAKEIHSIISDFAELDRMLFRSLASIYENIQTFLVAEDDDGQVIGCAAMSVLWSDLAEVKSLAVKRNMSGRGIGRKLVAQAVEKAKELGVERLFALTLEPEFFEKVGFTKVEKRTLPMKVWSDCANCPKQDQCDETAFILDLKKGE
jgi:amino-acid N-acetyltransferase